MDKINNKCMCEKLPHREAIPKLILDFVDDRIFVKTLCFTHLGSVVMCSDKLVRSTAMLKPMALLGS